MSTSREIWGCYILRHMCQWASGANHEGSRKKSAGREWSGGRSQRRPKRKRGQKGKEAEKEKLRGGGMWWEWVVFIVFFGGFAGGCCKFVEGSLFFFSGIGEELVGIRKYRRAHFAINVGTKWEEKRKKKMNMQNMKLKKGKVSSFYFQLALLNFHFPVSIIFFNCG